MSELDQTITGINNIYRQIQLSQVSNDVDIKMNLYNKILSDCSYAITSIHNIQLRSPELINNIKLQQRHNILKQIQLRIKQEQLDLQRKQEILKAQQLYRENQFKKQQEESYLNQKPKTLEDIINLMKAIHKQMIKHNNNNKISELYHKAQEINQSVPGIIKSTDENLRHTHAIEEKRAIIAEIWETIDKLYAQSQQQPPRQEELPRQQQPQEPRTERLLTPEQIALAKIYFANNPTQTKLSRKTPILDNNGNQALLPYSIMKSADQKLYALYRGKQAYLNPENKQGFLGQGSFGRVKLAQCLDDGKIVAAKMALINKDQTVANINKEKAMQAAAGQYLGSTNRENIMYKNKHYIFSKFIEGESLTNVFFMPNTTYLIPKKNISSNDKKGTLEIILATLQATQELHKKGIIHCDLSFNNILYNRETKKATIIDFGSAVKSNQDLIQDPLIRLPYAIPFDPNEYSPPELNGARANYRSDIYSIGKWINWYANATRDPFLQELSRGMLNPDPTKRVNAQMCIDKINTALYNQQYTQPRRPW